MPLKHFLQYLFIFFIFFPLSLWQHLHLRPPFPALRPSHHPHLPRRDDPQRGLRSPQVPKLPGGGQDGRGQGDRDRGVGGWNGARAHGVSELSRSKQGVFRPRYVLYVVR